MYVHMSVWEGVCVQVCVHVNVCTGVCVHVSVCMGTVYVCMHMYTCAQGPDTSQHSIGLC